jgi:hypothetical protein
MVHPNSTSAAKTGNHTNSPSLIKLFRGIHSYEAENRMHDGTYWPPNVFYETRYAIEKERLDFLLDFWSELKDFGILKRTTDFQALADVV